MHNSPYLLLYKQAQVLLSDEPDFIANAANLSSLIYNNMDAVNWVGFYFLKPALSPGGDSKELVLGPFSGQLACTRIRLGKGVCGTAFATQQTQLVNDVHEFPGHIACDAASKSELVVPFDCGDYKGVFDIDSPIKSRFAEPEKEFFEAVAALLK